MPCKDEARESKSRLGLAIDSGRVAKRPLNNHIGNYSQIGEFGIN
jgi:hypothetical protein